MRYAAHGLDLHASFALPGMPEATPPPDMLEATTDRGLLGAGLDQGLPDADPRARAAAIDPLPALALELVTPAELDAAWSGSREPPQWRGRQGDGLDLAIERGAGGDRRFSYGAHAPASDDRARFRLHRGMARIDCAPTGPGLGWQRVLLAKVLPAVSVMRGYEALHAAAVDSPQGVVAIMAPSGMGKSTLASELLRRGWPLFADDQLTLDCVDGAVRAHPGTPHMNLAARLPDTLDPETLGATLGMVAGERWLAAYATTSEPRPVRMLCLLERGRGLPLQASILPASPLPLAPYVLGLETNAERLGRRFRLYADLIESAALVSLTADLEHPPGALADLLEATLARRPELVGGGIA
jgi:hypothetical protein